ncbi:MAG: carboxypeptidase regulatory-like domain-containing protein [Planctomycetes bacterium]|nr:carboxypeptidase regulatory-like domain-containing protein [Planctomycetota bacterium]
MTNPSRLPQVRLGDGATDFRLVAIQEGTALLDRRLSYWPLVLKWLGRFAGDPEWIQQSVRFHVRGEQGQRLTSGIVCEPIQPGDLRGPLRHEWSELQKKLKEAQATSKTDQVVLKALTESLTACATDLLREDLSCRFFKYRDSAGKRRLLWCWGYDRTDQKDCAAALCVNPDCSQVFLRRGSLDSCPLCQTVLPIKRNPFKWVAAAVLMILFAGGGGYWYLFLSAVLSGTVTSGVDKTPLAGAEVRVNGLPLSTQTDAEGKFRLTGLPAGTKKVSIALSGYVTRQVEATFEGAKQSTIAVTLMGDAVVQGRTIDSVTRAAVSGVEVKIPHTVLTTTTDGEGRFRIEGVKGGSLELYATALGYPPGVTKAEVVSGKETSVDIELTGSAILTGQVVNAVNKEPIAKAVVQIVSTGNKVETDGNGRYRFEKVRGGVATIEVTADGFSKELKEQELIENESRTLAVLLVGSALLTGQVTTAVDNEPVANAEVRVIDTPLSVRTDKSGRFGLPGIRSGAAQIEVSAPGYALERLSRELVPGAETQLPIQLRGDAVLIGLVVEAATDQPVADADIKIKGMPYTARTDKAGKFRILEVCSRLSTVTVSATGFRKYEVEHQLLPGKETDLKLPLTGDAVVVGSILNSDDDSPIVGAEVSSVGTTLSALTDNQGHYRLDGVRSGTAQLKFAARGFPDEFVKQDLPANANTKVLVSLHGTAVLVGQVVNGLTKVPVANATVSIAGTKQPIQTDAEGKFRREKLRGGPIELEVAAVGYKTKKLGVKLELAKETIASLVLSGDAVLAGTVLESATSEPISNAEISLEKSPLAIQTDAEGKFTLEGASPGKVTVTVRAAGFDARDAEVELASGKTTDLKISLTGNGELSGVVLTDDGKPVAGATIQRTGTKASVQTDKAGRFTWPKMRSGIAKLTVSALGYETVQVDKELVAGEAATLATTKLSSDLVLTGQVINAVTEKPIPTARVELIDRKVSVDVDDEGRFRLARVPAQPFKVRVTAADFYPEDFDANPLEEKTAVRYVLSPILKPGEARVVLTWGSDPKDLDLHLYGPLTVGQNYHVSYKARQQGNVVLDVDNREGYGPETALLNHATPGSHEIKVHAFRGVKNTENGGTQTGEVGNGSLATSNASVRVYIFGTREPQILQVDPKAPGSVWNVGRLEVIADGQIFFKKQNTYSEILP